MTREEFELLLNQLSERLTEGTFAQARNAAAHISSKTGRVISSRSSGPTLDIK